MFKIQPQKHLEEKIWWGGSGRSGKAFLATEYLCFPIILARVKRYRKECTVSLNSEPWPHSAHLSFNPEFSLFICANIFLWPHPLSPYLGGPAPFLSISFFPFPMCTQHPICIQALHSHPPSLTHTHTHTPHPSCLPTKASFSWWRTVIKVKILRSEWPSPMGIFLHFTF